MNGSVIHRPGASHDTQPTALDTYLERLPLGLDKIETLGQLADDRCDHDPDAIHWTHAGDLRR